jgi:hypothetical protein
MKGETPNKYVFSAKSVKKYISGGKVTWKKKED